MNPKITPTPRHLTLRGLSKYLLILTLMLGGCNADYQSKKWAETNLKDKPTVTVLKGFLDLGFAKNRGMVFGILNNHMPSRAQTILLVFRALMLLGLTIGLVMIRKQPILLLLPFALLWAGAIGNLIDPFVYGYVVDFIHIGLGRIFDWPFYINLADVYVTVGVAMLLLNTHALGKLIPHRDLKTR